MLPGRCTADKRCMEPDCPECEGLRFFSGLINAIALMVLFVSVLVAFGWFAYSAYELWGVSNGHH